jgi:hypothetical protein
MLDVGCICRISSSRRLDIRSSSSRPDISSSRWPDICPSSRLPDISSSSRRPNISSSSRPDIRHSSRGLHWRERRLQQMQLLRQWQIPQAFPPASDAALRTMRAARG